MANDAGTGEGRSRAAPAKLLARQTRDRQATRNFGRRFSRMTRSEDLTVHLCGTIDRLAM
jgi:hypothetical protein